MCGNTSKVIVFSDKHKVISSDICSISSFHICYILELNDDYDLETWLQKFIMVYCLHFGSFFRLQYTVRGEFYGEGRGLVIIAIAQ